MINTHLAPGMRKLPSELDVEILQALIATEFERNGSKPVKEKLLAKLTSKPYFAGNNSFGFDGQGSLPETKFYPNHNLPTQQMKR